MNDPEPRIVLRDVSYDYGRGALRQRVLSAIELSIAPGEIVILTGPSGSGKTTLLSLVGALRATRCGSVSVLGQELCGARESAMIAVRRQIGYVFQQHNLLDSLSVTQNIQLAMQLVGGRDRASTERRIAQVLEQVGMAQHASKKPRQLSGGQQQRVGIARALVGHPRVILADEPTASLDSESGRTVVDLIQELAREEAASVVLVTHDNRILDVADRIIRLEDGRIQRTPLPFPGRSSTRPGLMDAQTSQRSIA